MVNPDEDILQQFVQEEPSESPLTLLAGNTTTTNDAPSGSLNAYRASGASVQPAKSAAEIYNQLHPEAATRIQRFFELADERGLGLKPGSMNRDYGTQAKMYANRASNPYPVAPPGGSAHMGFATDFSGYKPEKLQAIRELAKEVGLVYGGNWSGKTFDPVHIQLGPGNEVTRYIQQHINPQAGSVNWEGVRTTALPEDFLKRAIAAAQGQNVDAIYVPTKEVKVEGAPNATGSATVEPDAVKEADAKVEVTKKRKDIDFAKLIKMLDDSTHGGADYLSRSMQANAQQAQANRSRSLAQIAQFDQEQVNKMAEALKGGRTQSFKEGGEFEEDDNPYKDQVVKEYKPTLRDRIANLLAGDEPSFDKQRIVENIAGSRGIGATGIGALDFVPIVGNALGADESLREGDYKGAALAVMPVPPAARMVAPVAKAETKNILNIAEKYGVEPKEETWKHGISKNKLSRPIEEMSATTTDKNNVIPRKFITPADLKGGVIVPALGDRTAANQWLTHINEKELAYPVDLEGGANFMRSAAASGPDQAAWASQQGIISRLAKAAEAASKTGEPHLAFTAMSNRSGDYSGIMTDAILSQLPESKIAKKDIKAFDTAMKKFDPKWPGIEDKNIKDHLMNKGPLKTRFAETIARKPFQDAGFPDIGSTRFAITDPELLHVPTGSSGYAISKLDPSGRVIINPAVPHSTYKAQLGGEGYVGGFEHHLPLEITYSDWAKKQNPDILANAAIRDYKFKLDLPTQHASPEWVDQAMAWLRKNYPDIGYAKGGEVEGEDTPNLDKLMSDLMKERTTEAEIIDNGFKPRDYDPAKITQALSIMSGSKDPSTQLQLQYMLGKLGLNAGVLQSDKYRGYNAGVNIPLSDTSSVNLGGNYGRVMGAYGQESPASWGVRGSYVKRFAEGGPKLPDRPEYEMTDSSNAVDATPNTSLEQLFQALTGGRNLQNDLSNIKSRLPTGQDYGHALLEQRDSTQAMNEQGRQNLREGYANRDIPQMLLGTGQGALGLINPAMAPINAGFEVLSKTAGKFDPRAKVEAELLGLVGTEGAGVTQKLHNLEFPKSSWDALLKKYQDSGATQAMTIGLPAAVAAAERPVEAATRSLSPVGLYSHAAEMAEALPQAKGTPEQMRAMLFDKYGVKPAELEGFEEKFFGRPSVTKEELATHFRERMPQVEEKVLGKTVSEPYPEELNKIEQQIQAKHGPEIEEALAKYRDGSLSPEERNVVYNDLRKLQKNYEKELYEAVPNRDELRRKANGIITPTKYQKWSLPGGENYREVLLKLPEQEHPLNVAQKKVDEINQKLIEMERNGVPENSAEWKAANAELMKADIAEQNVRNKVSSGKIPHQLEHFQSSHWEDEPNVLAHLRMSDRTGPNGEKLLHVEEMQSDWGQKGRQEGFKNQNKSKLSVVNEGGIWRVRDSQGQRVDLNGSVGFGTEEQARNAIAANTRDIGGVPEAPYVTSTQGWTDLALKRVLKEAAEGGYDGVVFTPGAEQAKRYDLSQQVGRIDAEPANDGKIHLSASSPDMQNVVHRGFYHPDELDSVIGKELADKIRNQIEFPKTIQGHVVKNRKSGLTSDVFEKKEEAEKALNQYPDSIKNNLIVSPVEKKSHGKDVTLSGLDLSFGGEGMKSYYDKMVPNYLQKLAKQHDKDAKLGTMRTNSLPDMLHMPVTDKMREHILKGQKAYMRGGRVGYADGGLVADNADGTGRQHYDAYGNVSDAQGGPVRAVAYDQNLVNTLAQQLNEGTYG